MNSTKTPILILLLILLFLLIKCNSTSETFQQLGTITSWSCSEPATLNSLKNEEVINSTFKPSHNEVIRTNLFCNKCKQDGFEFKCTECAPHIPEKLGKFYYRYIKAKKEIDLIDKDYTDGTINELEFHTKFKSWFDKYKDLTMIPKNKIRQHEIINDCDIFDIDETHKISVADNELENYIPLKTISKIIKYNAVNKNSNFVSNNNNIFSNLNKELNNIQINNNSSYSNLR